MTPRAVDQFLTPREGRLSLRSSRDPSRERTARRGEPLLVVSQVADGFVEVDIAGERWFAQAAALEAWRTESPPESTAPPPPPPPTRPDVVVGRPPSRRQSKTPWLVVLFAMLAVVLTGVVLTVTEVWKVPAGWVLCEDGVPVEEVRRVDFDFAFRCDGRLPRDPFRGSGVRLDVVEPVAMTARRGARWNGSAI